LYEGFDTLDMQERIQHAVRGVLAGIVSMFSRSSMSVIYIFQGLFLDGYLPPLNEPGVAEKFEADVTQFIYLALQTVTEGPGLTDYEYLPYQLIMGWDENWTERFIYYRPCANKSDRGYCDLLPPEAVFVSVDKTNPSPYNPNNNWTLAHKNEVPRYFHEFGEKMKNRPEEQRHICENPLRCTGIASIPEEEGGPMMFTVFGMGDSSAMFGGMPFPFDYWHFAVASNAQLMSQLQANRTGLCTSLYSEKDPNIPEAEKEEFKNKRDGGLILNPADVYVDINTYITQILIDTGNVTLMQDYYSNRINAYVDSDRAICDAFYDHGDEQFVSKTTTYLDYATFDSDKLEQDYSNTVMFRFDYHDPLTKDAYALIKILVVIVSAIWVLTIVGVFVYFDVQFLRPLDNMRKMREDMIKTALAGLDDDGVKAKELFGDLTDDTALLKAGGDEIKVMLTLQDRVDALYSSVINSRVDDLNRVRANTRREMNALRVMNIFMRRDDEALRIVLPGLMDSNEMARRFRRTTLNVRGQKGETWMDELANAKHSFRTLKSVLSNHIAAQYFKAFCTQRGRSSVNSFFFLMDVSWLHQVESGARDEAEDFLSAMFSDSVSPSPASMSPRSPYGRDGMSSDRLVSPESSALDLGIGAPDPDVNRPHRSHFAKSAGNKAHSQSSASSDAEPKRVPSADGNKADEKKPKVPKLPVSAMKSSPAPTSPSLTSKNAPQFLTKIGEGIAHFIHESYFGKKSLAQHDMRHAALLGCSQIPDYLSLRDSDKITYSPVMYDNLVAAVTKKFTSEVLPQFLNSVSFQVMVLSLKITKYFGKKDGKIEKKEEQPTNEAEATEMGPAFKRDEILKEMWQAAKGEKKNDDESDESDDSSSSSSDDDDEEEEEKEKEPKKPEQDKPKEEESDSSNSDDSDSESDD